MTHRLLERRWPRTLSIGAAPGLDDQTSAPSAETTNDASVFTSGDTTRPRLSLAPPRPAAGMLMSVAAIASGTGSLADNDPATLKIYGAIPAPGEGLNRSKDGGAEHERIRLLATLVCTFGNKTEDVWIGGAPERGGADIGVRWADTMALTLEAYGTALLDTAYGAAPAVFSPADDTVAELLLPQLPGLAAVVVDGTAAADATLYLDARNVA